MAGSLDSTGIGDASRGRRCVAWVFATPRPRAPMQPARIAHARRCVLCSGGVSGATESAGCAAECMHGNAHPPACRRRRSFGTRHAARIPRGPRLRRGRGRQRRADARMPGTRAARRRAAGPAPARRGRADAGALPARALRPGHHHGHGLGRRHRPRRRPGARRRRLHRQALRPARVAGPGEERAAPAAGAAAGRSRRLPHRRRPPRRGAPSAAARSTWSRAACSTPMAPSSR